MSHRGDPAEKQKAPAANAIGVMIAPSKLMNVALSLLPDSAKVLLARCTVTATLILMLPKISRE